MARNQLQQARLDALEPLIRSWTSTSSIMVQGSEYPSEPDRPFPHFPGPDDGGHRSDPSDADTTLALLLPLLILLSTLLFLLLLFLVFLVVVRRRGGRGGILHALGGGGAIRLGENEGPIDLSRDDESWAEGEGGVEGMERRWLEQSDEGSKIGYMRSKGAPSLPLFKVTTNARSNSLANPVPAQLATDRHHSFAIPLDPRKGRLGVVLRTRLRLEPFFAGLRPLPDGNYFPRRRRRHGARRRGRLLRAE